MFIEDLKEQINNLKVFVLHIGVVPWFSKLEPVLAIVNGCLPLLAQI